MGIVDEVKKQLGEKKAEEFDKLHNILHERGLREDSINLYNFLIVNDLGDLWDSVKKDEYKKLISSLLPKIKDRKAIIDIGCFNGQITYEFAIGKRDSYVVGMDISDKSIEQAKKKYGSVPNLEFIVGDMLNIPFKKETFDSVIISNVVHETMKEEQVNGKNIENYLLIPKFKEVYRILRPFSMFIIATGFEKCIIENEFKWLLENMGFQEMNIETFNYNQFNKKHECIIGTYRKVF